MTEHKEAYETDEKQPFEITDISSLTWVFREVLKPLKEKIEQTNELKQQEIERIEAWAENEKRGPLQEIEYWEQRIADYHLQLLDSDPKQKTLSTPYGKSSSRKSKASPQKADDEKLLEYVKSNNLTDLLNVKESVKWGDLKKTFVISGENVVDSATGEIVNGVTIKPETITTKVELT